MIFYEAQESNRRDGSEMKARDTLRKPESADEVRMLTGRRTHRYPRSGSGGKQGRVPQEHDANIDLLKLDPETRGQVLEQMRTVFSDGRDYSMRLYRIMGIDGKEEVIIDL